METRRRACVMDHHFAKRMEEACFTGDLEAVNSLVKQDPSYVNLRISCIYQTPLIIAAIAGHAGIVSLLLKHGADVDKFDIWGYTALHKAVTFGQVEVVELLLEAGADIRMAKSTTGNTALSIAAGNCHVHVVRTLLENGAPVDSVDTAGKTALFKTTITNEVVDPDQQLQVVQILLDAGANPDGTTPEGRPLVAAAEKGLEDISNLLIKHGALVNVSDPRGRSPLHFASLNGQYKIVRALLDARANINKECNDASTPLMLAIRNGHTDVAELLISQGACINKRDCQGRTALHYADSKRLHGVVSALLDARAKLNVDRCKKCNDASTALFAAVNSGRSHVAELLISRGACVNKQDPLVGQTPLYIASLKGLYGLVRILLDAEANIDKECCDSNASTPFLVAINNGHTDVAELLLSRGASVNKQDHQGQTALHLASLMGLHRIVCLLLDAGVNIDKECNDASTPLLLAISNGHTHVAEMLISRGASINKQNHQGQTVLHLASLMGLRKIVCILLAAGLNIDKEFTDGSTPLLVAISSGHTDVAEMLIHQGASVNKQDHQGQTALHLASSRGLQRIVCILLNAGANIDKECNDASNPLLLAIKGGHTDVAELLISRGACVTKQDHQGRTFLHQAALTLNLTLLKLLLDQNVTVDKKDHEDDTPLVLASKANVTSKVNRRKQVKVTMHLFIHGADLGEVASTSGLRVPVLSLAVNNGFKEHVERALMSGVVNVNAILKMESAMTPLMWAASEGRDALVRSLILQGAHVNYSNGHGSTALQLAAECNHIQCGVLLVEAGADHSILTGQDIPPFRCSSEFKDAIKKTLSFQTKKTVCVIGNAKNGESTLISFLQNENATFSQKMLNRLYGVCRDIQQRTTGIEPCISSKRYGEVVFFDFAGQQVYHGPHEQFLQSIPSRSLSTVTFIVVVNATENEEDILDQIIRWLHPLSKLPQSCSTVRLIIIANHLNEFRHKGPAKEKLKRCCRQIQGNLSSPLLRFEVLCCLDCHDPYASDITKLCQYLNQVPLPKFKATDLEYSLSWVISHIRSTLSTEALSVADFSQWLSVNRADLPTNLPSSEEICQDLSSTGHFLYLPCDQEKSEGWLVLDLIAILHQVYVTLFSLDNPIEVADKFGIVSVETIARLFSKLDTRMICDVLVSLEFCILVDTEIVHKLKRADQDVPVLEAVGEYLFFPALVSSRRPKIFNVNSTSDLSSTEMAYFICWQFVVKEKLFISSCLLQTIILRLVSHLHVFRHHHDPSSVQHYCQVWWNGVFWQSSSVDVAVQISESSVVQVIGRSSSPAELCKYLSSVTRDIFKTIQDLSPGLSGAAYIVHPGRPQELLERPRAVSPREMFPVDFIQQSMVREEDQCISRMEGSTPGVRVKITDLFSGYQPSLDVIAGLTAFFADPPSSSTCNQPSASGQHSLQTTPTDSTLSAPSDVPQATPTGVQTTPTDLHQATPNGGPQTTPTGVQTTPTDLPQATPTGGPQTTLTGVQSTPTGVPQATPTGGPQTTPTGVQTAPTDLTQAAHNNVATLPHVQLLETHKQDFLSCVVSKALLLPLKVNGNVIPEQVAFQMRNGCDEDSNYTLYLHLRNNSDIQAICTFCEILVKVGKGGYPLMKQFGEKFIQDLKSLHHVPK